MESKKNGQSGSGSTPSNGGHTPRRRSGGGGAAGGGGGSSLRSPAVKRPASAPVALQGWLHKQGSEGLMLWKKRWFVLSEYCLFYYKGSEEQRLLGSILLPSYKISPCGAEDRVFRKYSFKAEHANMRTYYFAADSRELMVQWMNALSLASILQHGSSWEEGKSQPRPSVPSSVSSATLLNHSADADSDSGFHGGGGARTPDTHPLGNGWPRASGYVQPVYANAPPKPRRASEQSATHPHHPQNIQNGFMPRLPGPQQPVRYQHYHQHQSVPPQAPSLLPVSPGHVITERRTPDTYGRSNVPNTSVQPPKDYEDVYGSDGRRGSGSERSTPGSSHTTTTKYRRPSGQVAYLKGAGPPMVHPPPRYQPPPQPPRPHSADFLDFDAKRCYQMYQSPALNHPPEHPIATVPRQRDHSLDHLDRRSINREIIVQQPIQHSQIIYAETPQRRSASAARLPRPKSSMEVVPPDSLYWSEESYARQMRQASYLQHTSSPPRVAPPQGVEMVGYPCSPSHGLIATSTPSPYQVNLQNRRWSEFGGAVENASPTAQQQFVRSASARLSRQVGASSATPEGKSPVSESREGEKKFQQREESMKRLLEWKQRMLQSPLTRKPSSGRGASHDLATYYKHQVLRELASQETGAAAARRRRSGGGATPSDDAASVASSSLGRAASRSRSHDGRRGRYNSCSSDDEAATTEQRRARKRVRRSGAGDKISRRQRSGVISTTLTSVSPELKTAPLTETSAMTTVAPITGGDSGYDTLQVKLPTTSEPEMKEPLQVQPPQYTPNEAHVSSLRSDKQDDQDEEVAAALGQSEELISSCRDMGSSRTEEELEVIITPGYLRLSLAESLVTPAEDHYMPMTPSRKAVLAPPEAFMPECNSLMDSLLAEESSYVEMTEEGLSRSLLAPDEENTQLSNTHYELLSRASNHGEPVYMEVTPSLAKPSDEINDISKQLLPLPPPPPLPDIIEAVSVPDSSDADDEASKELDSLDAPRHPRFSLSDTFRPASYYLGVTADASSNVSNTNAETVIDPHLDSSDSDLVSPPPIPTSPPPPSDELETSLETSTTQSSIKRRPLSNSPHLLDLCLADLSLSMSEREDEAHYENLNVILPPPPEHMMPNEEDQLSLGAPYYYSDLLQAALSEEPIGCIPARSLSQLNNLRDAADAKNPDIDRQVNSITADERRRLTAELRSHTSAFLHEKPELDQRNLFEADTLRRRARSPDVCTTAAVNLYPHGLRDKTITNSNNNINNISGNNHRRARSLEGLLDSPQQSSRLHQPQHHQQLLPQHQHQQSDTAILLHQTSSLLNPVAEDHWEQDTLWRESLRRVSRSLDNLDESTPKRRVTRDVTYVNIRPNQRRSEYEDDYREGRRRTSSSNPLDPDDGVHYERLSRYSESLERTRRGESYLEGYVWDEDCEVFRKSNDNTPSNEQRSPGSTTATTATSATVHLPPSFKFDREKLRQWDFMSTAPLSEATTQLPQQQQQQQHQLKETASGSSSVVGRDSLPPPRSVSTLSLQSKPGLHYQAPHDVHQPIKAPPTPTGEPPPQVITTSTGSLTSSTTATTTSPSPHPPISPQPVVQQKTPYLNGVLERAELIETRARLAEMDSPRRLEHLQKLEELKRHLLDLEKQYEKGKPLVNLVDNMVKLGSLYRGPVAMPPPASPQQHPAAIRECLEFNQKVQEQRLLAEERKEWNRLNPDRTQLQAKVQELYRLDRLLQQESGTLQSLQQDKELLEKALGGLRHRLQGARADPARAEHYRRQQRLLERELSRVRLLLAHNSKKLEETVTENARLEQELVVLRQKMQLQQYRRGGSSIPTDTIQPSTAPSPTPAHLECELRRVQQLVGDLQRQRHELSLQVRQLTEKSHTLVQQIRTPGSSHSSAESSLANGRRKQHSGTWLVTDLDTFQTNDQGSVSVGVTTHPVRTASPTRSSGGDQDKESSAECPEISSAITPRTPPPPAPGTPTSEVPPDYPPPPPPPTSALDETANLDASDIQITAPLDLGSEADEKMKRFYGIIPKERQQEIKTVRIVKRESERRQRDRDHRGIGGPLSPQQPVNETEKLVSLAEEDFQIAQQQFQYQLMQSIPSPVQYQQPGLPLTYKKAMLEERSQEDEEALFQRSMSLPRGFGKLSHAPIQSTPAPAPPPPRSDSVTALRNLMLGRPRVRFESGSGGESDSSLGGGTTTPSSAREQLFQTTSPPPLSPVFKSAAAREIVLELSGCESTQETSTLANSPQTASSSPQRRAVPRERRRHYTVAGAGSGNLEAVWANLGGARARDDLDMERALRPRLNATPDVVRSTLSHKDLKYNEETIDNVLGTPSKILIPERYVPEQTPELSAEERLQRNKKAEAIRKMLSETTSLSTPELDKLEEEKSSTLKNKMAAEKKHRDHILQLNQLLARQVMERSKVVAGSTPVPFQE